MDKGEKNEVVGYALKRGGTAVEVYPGRWSFGWEFSDWADKCLGVLRVGFRAHPCTSRQSHAFFRKIKVSLMPHEEQGY